MSLTLGVLLSALTRLATLSFGPEPAQRGELHLPRRGSGPWPVAVLLHGGIDHLARADVTLVEPADDAHREPADDAHRDPVDPLQRMLASRRRLAVGAVRGHVGSRP